MLSTDEFIRQWNINKDGVFKGIQFNDPRTINRLKENLEENIILMSQPAYVKYTAEWSMSPINPSLVMYKLVGGVRKPKLSDKIPNKYGVYFEYYYDKKGKCLYKCAIYPEQPDLKKVDAYYVYLDNTVYQLETADGHSRNEEYYYNNDNKVMRIRCYDVCGIEHEEVYDWVNDDIAVVTLNDERSKYLLIKDESTVLGVFNIIYPDKNNKVFSYTSQGYINTLNYTTKATQIIEHSSFIIEYAQIINENNNPTEYFQLNICGTSYIVFINYLKHPKSFSYKKAKEIYKNEVLTFIDHKINLLNFMVKQIGIQYFNYGGGSILDLIIGFDDVKNDDVHTMKAVFDNNISADNYEYITQMDNYISTNMYFISYRNIMKDIKKAAETSYNIPLVLDEVSD